MDKLPQISGKDLCRVLEKEGYIFVRQTGSHKIYQKTSSEGTITVPIPVHSNKPLKKGTLYNIQCTKKIRNNKRKARIPYRHYSWINNSIGIRDKGE
jgi:predicted RNA binding protein YcfA (HicA-like mRNA interferase family)